MLRNKFLCNLPVLLLITVASLDTADKQLLSSSFPILERTLHLDIKTLGYFSLFSNLSYALSLPFWGYLVHRHGIHKVYILLSIACFSWGVSTIGIAISYSITSQALLRILNGWMLGSILPLSQTLLVELVPNGMRGRAFGTMSLFEKLAGTLASSSSIYWEWKRSYYLLGLTSIFISWMVCVTLNPQKRHYLQLHEEQKAELTLKQIVRRIASLPAFRCLVAQGVFGGTPWDMMQFLLLLLEWRGFSREQIVCIQLSSGLAGTIGGALGGVLGDYAAYRYSTRGRIGVALFSIVCGIPLYGMFIYSTNYYSALFFINLFHIIASWSPSAAIRPICAELTHNPSERAQIVSMWILLEKVSAAIFGAPLVGYLTSKMLKHKNSVLSHEHEEKSSALAYQLFWLSSLFWMICAFFWVLMAQSMRKKEVLKNIDV